ncbi:MAG TPA: hypothetical protein VF695_01460 [Sphingomonas sp.]
MTIAASTLAGWYPDATGDAQRPADVAVMIPTIVRPTIARALQSIFDQRFDGRIQIVIGIDVQQGDAAPMLAAIVARPAHVSILVVHLPWSTSTRHGGVHVTMDGGGLKSILAFSANARLLAQLDDDNEWLPDHLALLHAAIQGKAWAYAQRFLVDENTGRVLGPDIWDSVGPGAGRFMATGGFVDPNCLMIDKVTLTRALSLYGDTLDRKPGFTSDRLLFGGIAKQPHGRVDQFTVRYYIRRINMMWQFLVAQQRAGGLDAYGWSVSGEHGKWDVTFR